MLWIYIFFLLIIISILTTYNYFYRYTIEIKAPVDRVYFTGEHTSESYNGYVHGAYLAGPISLKKVF